MLRIVFRAPLALFAAASLAACTGTGPVSPLNDGPEFPVYETFDPTGYEASPVAVAVKAVHDVSERLMDGRVVLPQTQPEPPRVVLEPRQVDGYRIQVFTSESRDTAERIRGEVSEWLSRNPSAAGSMQYGLPLVAYLQPYYRVRLGAFQRENEARQALELVRRQYPEAFIVPDLVTVMAPPVDSR